MSPTASTQCAPRRMTPTSRRSPHRPLPTVATLFVAALSFVIAIAFNAGGFLFATPAEAYNDYITANGLELENRQFNEHIYIYDNHRSNLRGATISLSNLLLPNFNIYFQDFASTNAVINIVACQYNTLRTTATSAGNLNMWTFLGGVAQNAQIYFGGTMQSFTFQQAKFKGIVDIQYTSQMQLSIGNSSDINYLTTTAPQSFLTITSSFVGFAEVNLEKGTLSVFDASVYNDFVISRYYSAIVNIDMSVIGAFRPNISTNVSNSNSVFNITNTKIMNGIDFAAQAYNTRLEVWWSTWNSGYGVNTTGLFNSTVAVYNSMMYCDNHVFYLRSGLDRRIGNDTYYDSALSYAKSQLRLHNVSAFLRDPEGYAVYYNHSSDHVWRYAQMTTMQGGKIFYHLYNNVSSKPDNNENHLISPTDIYLKESSFTSIVFEGYSIGRGMIPGVLSFEKTTVKKSVNVHFLDNIIFETVTVSGSSWVTSYNATFSSYVARTGDDISGFGHPIYHTMIERAAFGPLRAAPSFNQTVVFNNVACAGTNITGRTHTATFDRFHLFFEAVRFISDSTFRLQFANGKYSRSHFHVAYVFNHLSTSQFWCTAAVWYDYGNFTSFTNGTTFTLIDSELTNRAGHGLYIDPRIIFSNDTMFDFDQNLLNTEIETNYHDPSTVGYSIYVKNPGLDFRYGESNTHAMGHFYAELYNDAHFNRSFAGITSLHVMLTPRAFNVDCTITVHNTPIKEHFNIRFATGDLCANPLFTFEKSRANAPSIVHYTDCIRNGIANISIFQSNLRSSVTIENPACRLYDTQMHAVESGLCGFTIPYNHTRHDILVLNGSFIGTCDLLAFGSANDVTISHIDGTIDILNNVVRDVNATYGLAYLGAPGTMVNCTYNVIDLFMEVYATLQHAIYFERDSAAVIPNRLNKLYFFNTTLRGVRSAIFAPAVLQIEFGDTNRIGEPHFGQVVVVIDTPAPFYLKEAQVGFTSFNVTILPHTTSGASRSIIIPKSISDNGEMFISPLVKNLKVDITDCEMGRWHIHNDGEATNVNFSVSKSIVGGYIFEGGTFVDGFMNISNSSLTNMGLEIRNMSHISTAVDMLSISSRPSAFFGPQDHQVEDPAVRLLFSGFVGELSIRNSAASPPGAVLNIRNSSMASLDFSTHGGTISIDASNEFVRPHGGGTSTYISLRFDAPSAGNLVVLRGGNAATTSPLETHVMVKSISPVADSELKMADFGVVTQMMFYFKAPLTNVSVVARNITALQSFTVNASGLVGSTMHFDILAGSGLQALFSDSGPSMLSSVTFSGMVSSYADLALNDWRNSTFAIYDFFSDTVNFRHMQSIEGSSVRMRNVSSSLLHFNTNYSEGADSCVSLENINVLDMLTVNVSPAVPTESVTFAVRGVSTKSAIMNIYSTPSIFFGDMKCADSVRIFLSYTNVTSQSPRRVLMNRIAAPLIEITHSPQKHSLFAVDEAVCDTFTLATAVSTVVDAKIQVRNVTCAKPFTFGDYSAAIKGAKPAIVFVNSTIRLENITVSSAVTDNPGIVFLAAWLVNTSVAVVGASVDATGPIALDFPSLRLLEGSAVLVADSSLVATGHALRIELPDPPAGEALNPDGLTYAHGHSDADILGTDLAPRGIDRSVPSSVTIRRTFFGAPIAAAVALTNASFDADASNSYGGALPSQAVYNAPEGLNWAFAPTVPAAVAPPPSREKFLACLTLPDESQDAVRTHTLTQWTKSYESYWETITVSSVTCTNSERGKTRTATKSKRKGGRRGAGNGVPFVDYPFLFKGNPRHNP